MVKKIIACEPNWFQFQTRLPSRKSSIESTGICSRWFKVVVSVWVCKFYTSSGISNVGTLSNDLSQREKHQDCFERMWSRNFQISKRFDENGLNNSFGTPTQCHSNDSTCDVFARAQVTNFKSAYETPPNVLNKPLGALSLLECMQQTFGTVVFGRAQSSKF